MARPFAPRPANLPSIHPPVHPPIHNSLTHPPTHPSIFLQPTQQQRLMPEAGAVEQGRQLVQECGKGLLFLEFRGLQVCTSVRAR